ncbi:hypothetical protein C6P52_13530 [Enterococcus mundtii]|nr:hypothetical protein C6P52_13530 [Enterococcus mundtii]PTO43390.1 hypothetical protein C6P54_10280 [Enterococcus mundtii]QCJ63771.1 hypothetical protein C9423_05150 [Lactobacillus sp. Koumiss]BDP64222.1 hypothetical protein EfmJHP80_17180 [Enterococcus faecium]
MRILEIVWEVIKLISNMYFTFWLVCCLLYGFKWQVGNFMSVKIPGILRRSKRAYKEESK